MLTSRNHSIITYLPTVQDIYNVLSEYKTISKYAFIYHDKDLHNDGTLKEPHFHVCISCSNSIPCETCRRWFSDSERNINALSQFTKCNKAVFDYLTHKDDLSKYQYSDNLIHCNDISFFKGTVSDDIAVSIMDDLLNKRPLREMYKAYGKNFIYHYSAFSKLKEDILTEENNAKMEKVNNVVLTEIVDDDDIFSQCSIC